jgi:ribonuclease D
MKMLAQGRFYITSDEGLRQAAAEWQTAGALGIDTEFIRTDTFHPKPALIQISDGNQCWLVDVLTINDLSPLADIIIAPDIVKIFHAAGEDLEVFDRLIGKLPTPLFDTQIAASFCGHGTSIGYSKLVQAILDIELSKDQCRSDWLARPLTSEQLHYANLDVLYLPTIYQHLHNALTQQERQAWVHEENVRQLTRYEEHRGAVYNIDRINLAWKLDDTERKRLWHLLLGRDALARHHNKPRNHIAKDHVLMDMARKPPQHIAELSAFTDLRPSTIRQFGQHLITLANDTPAHIVSPLITEPLNKTDAARAKELRSLVESIAAGVGLPPELLTKRQELEALVREYQPGQTLSLPARFEGWRGELLSSAINDLMQQW